ncbi:UDP-N-acetylmuramoyl-L-alanyl-D-glutamate--2,6-diaminopimelate ligase [Leptotrichia sp. oral taxon 879]|uniref:UDP-N-acetylmuramoyl-L-alanyl-D-glutamate--2, 6-diaminopimelate ligase n=1 Tax=Leptotrichia sp. oral taxon 879 TaxID=1227267 RepID=UPI0003ADDB05|nr:UDP-N-acetylmuramoyl-L-alanyl-D-glutamate--2,6-diaminopimelate ligase [Leptotrichia sp. oral taxon 879]ERK55589.1 UDP-N-acetylmuramoyl-L-alanyl-D-glutamate--2,6-diaminopimelate ligase [Leptotrichia sp. oral taxon 879 str. F0557]
MYKIFKDVEYKTLKEGKSFEIKGIEYDSRKIEKDFVFVAMTGSIVDGHDFIQKAINNGAKMVISEKDTDTGQYKNIDDVTFIQVENIRKKLGIIASNYYSYPQNKIKIIGITGTNGKTTSSFVLENILEKTARIGTTGNRILDEEFETVNTTPESLELIKLIDKSVKSGADYFIMEVSSHALEIGRVDMLKFDSVIFTNLTQDHLDFHKTMENYFNAKKKIFSMLRNDKNHNGIGVINIDDEHGANIYSEKNGKNYISISVKDENADIWGDILNYTNNGMKVKINLRNFLEKFGKNLKNTQEVYRIEIDLVGEYNLYNLLGCVASVLSLGIEMDTITRKLETMPAVPGRFETIKNDLDVRIVVDFAHTDDGLLNVGKTLKQITDNRVITVFGAGGDRDHEKRPKMAQAATKFSDFIILTSDNPRTENPTKILADIEKGLIGEKFPFDKYLIIADREKAIKYATRMLEKGDSLLIAGKGHETYQIVGTEKIYFDDREVVKEALESKI